MYAPSGLMRAWTTSTQGSLAAASRAGIEWQRHAVGADQAFFAQPFQQVHLLSHFLRPVGVGHAMDLHQVEIIGADIP